MWADDTNILFNMEHGICTFHSGPWISSLCSTFSKQQEFLYSPETVRQNDFVLNYVTIVIVNVAMSNSRSQPVTLHKQKHSACDETQKQLFLLTFSVVENGKYIEWKIPEQYNSFEANPQCTGLNCAVVLFLLESSQTYCPAIKLRWFVFWELCATFLIHVTGSWHS